MMKNHHLLFGLFLGLYFVQPVYAAKTDSKISQEAKVLVEDIVYKIIPYGEDFKIIFKQHAGIYYLKSHSEKFKTIKHALEKSNKTGDKIKIKADPTSLEIEELVLL